MKRIFILLILVITCAAGASAQQKNAAGFVTDEYNAPLSGISVMEAGTAHGVVTDDKGYYNLPVNNDNTTIQFTGVGFLPKDTLYSGTGALNVVMAGKKNILNEVVVIAYGTQKKSTLTGAQSQLSGEELKRMPAMNISNMLAGRVSGLNVLQQSGRPGYDDATIRIRGLSSPGASPLLIVDGIERPFNNLDPNEVQSITILKDASATAPYGVRGSGGVILVVTKSGTNGKPSISYNGEVSMNTLTRFPKFLNGPDYMKWFRRGEQLDSEYIAHMGGVPIQFTYTDQEIADLTNGTNTNPFFANTDWVGMLTGNRAISTHHTVSVSGGAPGVKYFVNLGYLNQAGVVKGNDFHRYNLRGNVENNIGKQLTTVLNIGIRKEDRFASGIPADDNTSMNPFYQAVQ